MNPFNNIISEWTGNWHVFAILWIIFFMTLYTCSFVYAEVDTSTAVIHHTVSHDVSAKTIDQWHKERGWDGIGYHFVIRKDGTVEEGRSLSKQGAHAKGRNKFVGIVLTGYDEFTNLQIKSLKKLLRQLNTRVVERHHVKCPGEGLDVENLLN